MEQVSGQNSISPEEKLFNVIRSGKKNDSAVRADGDNPSTVTETTSVDKKQTIATKHPGLQQRKQSLSFSPEVIKNILNIQNFRPYVVYGILSTILVILMIVAGYTMVSQQSDITEITKFDRHSATRNSLLTFAEIEPFKQLDFYLQETAKRDIFHPIPEEPEKQIIKQKPKEDTKKKLQEIIQTLTLRGIAWGEEPKVIIKDKDGQLYFLKEGQPIGTSGAKIKKIDKDKIIIQYKDAESEL